jgi:hypothetical protein
MLPRQHLHWARLARKLGRPDFAKQHENLARVIEKVAQRDAATAHAQKCWQDC